MRTFRYSIIYLFALFAGVCGRSRGAGSAAGLKMAMSEDELRRRQRTKNVALAVGLVGLVVLFYLLTLVKIGGSD